MAHQCRATVTKSVRHASYSFFPTDAPRMRATAATIVLIFSSHELLATWLQ
jgi:hypothetical protein